MAFGEVHAGEVPAAEAGPWVSISRASTFQSARRSGYSRVHKALSLRLSLVQFLEGTIIVAMDPNPLTRDEAVKRLVAAEPEIRALGVRRLALFGSVLRNEAGPDSDVDLLVQFAPGTKTFDRFLALFDLLEERLGRRVELVTTEALSPFIGPRILAEAEDVLRAA